MKKVTVTVIATLIGVTSCVLLFGMPATVRSSSPTVPEFTHTSQNDWLNSPPLSLATLRGKVVLVEFWTFDCINCLRSIPWVKSMQARHAGKDLAIVAVHTPELPHEKQRKNIVEALSRLGITYPVMLDTDYSYWNALDNRYWPAFYLIDKTGVLREIAIGEMHVGETRAASLEMSIAVLFAQPSNSIKAP